jgi:hypothetical protein
MTAHVSNGDANDQRSATRLRALLAAVRGVVSSIPGASDGWSSYHRAVALGLLGNVIEASPPLARLGNPSHPVPWQAELATLCLVLQRLLATPTEFRAVIVRMIQQQRSALRLAKIHEPLTDTYVATPDGTVVR